MAYLRVPSDPGERRVNACVPSAPVEHVNSMASVGILNESRRSGENLMAGGSPSDPRQDMSYNRVPSEPREHGISNRVPSDPRKTPWARASDTPLDGPPTPVQVPERANMGATANDIREDRDVTSYVARRLLELGMQEAEPGVDHEAIDRKLVRINCLILYYIGLSFQIYLSIWKFTWYSCDCMD